MTSERKSPYLVEIDTIGETPIVYDEKYNDGKLGAKIAYGKDVSLMIAVRQPGYHSKPHKHIAEQLNYFLAGEAYVFIDGEVVHGKKGDVIRIPSNAIHWSWIQGTEPCEILEVHTPSLIGDPGVLDHAVSLLTEEEKAEGFSSCGNEFLDEFDPAPIEKKLLGTNA
ncbi:MAG: cupin domain-containing protein [Pseudomonadota bacterium]|nr:cupin domain-containing protein [Pseudomonadota bacterium]